MTTNHNPQPDPAVNQPGESLLPDELLAASHRMAASRAKGARMLSRSRSRRRILPTIVVASMALFGAGLANAFVGSTFAPTTSVTTTSATAATSQQNATNAITLARLSAAIAADQRTLAALASSTAKTSAVAASAGASPISTATSQPGSGLVSTPPPVATAPAPSAAPTTHATTGASSVG